MKHTAILITRTSTYHNHDMPETFANPTKIPGMTCSIVASVNIVEDAFWAEGDFINITTDPSISATPTSI